MFHYSHSRIFCVSLHAYIASSPISVRTGRKNVQIPGSVCNRIWGKYNSRFLQTGSDKRPTPSLFAACGNRWLPFFFQQKSQSTGFPISGGHTVCPSSFTIFTNSSIGISRTLLIRQTNVAEGFSFVPRSRSRMYRSELSQSSASRICDSRFCFLAARSLLASNLASMPFTHFHAESIKEDAPSRKDPQFRLSKIIVFLYLTRWITAASRRMNDALPFN